MLRMMIFVVILKDILPNRFTLKWANSQGTLTPSFRRVLIYRQREIHKEVRGIISSRLSSQVSLALYILMSQLEDNLP